MPGKRTFAKFCPADQPHGAAVKEVLVAHYQEMAKAYVYYSIMGGARGAGRRARGAIAQTPQTAQNVLQHTCRPSCVELNATRLML